MALCTQADVEARLQITFDNQPDATITALIAAAEGHIERIAARTGSGESSPQSLEAASRTETFDAPESPAIWLVHTPVNSITSVTVDGTALTADTDFKWHPSGRLIRLSGGIPRHWATRKAESVVVVYNGGFQTVPEDIKDVCARAVARAFQGGAAYAAAPDGAEAIRQISLAGSDSVTFATAVQDVSTLLGLLEDEKNTIRYYRNDVLA